MDALDMYTDDELIDLLKNSNEQAFTVIYRRHWQSLYQHAYRVLGDEAACMDVLQEVFVWLWEHRSTLVIRELKPYLSTAVKFKMLNFIRHGKISEAAIEHYKKSGASLSYIDNSLELEELKAMIDQFIWQLPPKAARIFYLSRTEQLSHKEIAAQLNLSEKTVKNQINISLKKLRATLGQLSSWASFFL